jgi:hypothetical protein
VQTKSDRSDIARGNGTAWRDVLERPLMDAKLRRL